MDKRRNNYRFLALIAVIVLGLSILAGQLVDVVASDLLSDDPPPAVVVTVGTGALALMLPVTLLGAVALDMSTDAPATGQGLYYLVRPLGCGSWQSEPGAEPGRDTALP